MIRSFFLSFLLIFSLCRVQAQEIELGGGAALIQYKGDLQLAYNPFRSKPGVSLFARFNTEKGINFRISGLIGQIEANPDKSRDPFISQLNRYQSYTFTKNIFEYSIAVEYNFLDFRTKRSRYVTDWTPYIFGGVSLLTMGSINATPIPTFQLGFGVKKQLNPHINISAEFGSRFTYKDDTTIDALGYDKDNNTPNAFFNVNQEDFIDPNDPTTTKISFDDLMQISSPNKAQRDAQYDVQLRRRLSYPATLQMDRYFVFQVSVSYFFQRVYCPK